MKRTISVILAVMILLLSFTGCGDSAPKYSKEWGYNYFPGTDWGMTKDEVFKALSLNESDFELTVEDDEFTPAYYYIAEDIKISDKKYDAIKFSFVKKSFIDEPVFIDVTYIIKNSNMDTFEKTYKELLSMAQDQDEESYLILNDETKDSNDKIYVSAVIKSKNLVSDLDEDIKEKVDTYLEADWNLRNYDDSSMKRLTADSFHSELSTIRIDYSESFGTVTVSFDGNVAATLKASLEAKY